MLEKWNRLRDTTKAILLMILTGFSVAVMGTFIYILGPHQNWLFIAAFRALITFIIGIMLARKQRVAIFDVKNKTLWLRSISGSIGLISTFYALTCLPISDAAVILETSPIFVALFAPFVVGEKRRKKIWIILALSMSGVILLTQPHFGERNLAVLVAILGSFAGAHAMLFLRRLKDLPQITTVTQFSGTATFFCVISLLLFKQKIDLSLFKDIQMTAMFLAIGACGTIAQFSLTKAYSLAEASTVATAAYSRMGFATIFDVIFFKKAFGLLSVAGMALIISALTWLLWKEKEYTQSIDKEKNVL